MKRDYFISRQMQKDLMESYKQVCGTCWSQREAYERMVRQPAPRYYVTAKQACQVLSPMVKGDFELVNMMKPVKREMYYSLFNEVNKLSEKREFIGRGLLYIVREAILQPAPRFFISAERARIIRTWMKQGLFDEDGSFRYESQKWYGAMRERQEKRKEERKKWIAERTLREEKAAGQ